MADPKVTQLLANTRNSHRQAPKQLLPLVYDELRQLAKLKMVSEAAGHTLQPTVLIHVTYLQPVADNTRSELFDN